MTDNNNIATQPERGFFAYHGLWAPGVRLLRMLGFRTQTAIVSLLLIVPLLALLAWQIQGGFARGLQSEKEATRDHVEVAHRLLGWAHAMELSGQLNRAQAQALALDAVASLRYGHDEYFWINDMTPRVVMHPLKPELNGQDVSGMKDPNGLALFMAFVDTVRREKAGFVAYQWPRAGSPQPVDKISYVKGFEPWGWVVGSGIYIDHVQAQANAQARVTGAIALLIAVVGGYLFWTFYLVIDGGLRETERHLHAMADGDLTTVPRPWGSDEAARLLQSLRAMQDSLRGTVQRVRSASDDIVHSSGDIASGAQDLSARTETTAANLQQTAASMERIAATVQETAEHVQQAAGLARGNAQVAERGGQVMQQMVATMEDIHASSNTIADIVGTIDSIAFQTNILALNAAVEAARAGESGRGFAVVAQEVRALAQRSAGAAREIKALIGGSVDKVKAGTTIVREAGRTIEEIVGNTARVNELLEQIASGARDQSLGVAQIGQAVTDLDRTTQQNSALVEQTAAAATVMKDQAHALVADVARFRIPTSASTARLQGASTVADFDFDTAIDAHRKWKVKLRSAIAAHETLDAQTICRDDQCPLGRWIHGPGGAKWGSRPRFVELTQRHAEFHRAAGDVAGKINAGAYAEAERLIGAGSRFAEISVEVITQLSQAKHGL